VLAISSLDKAKPQNHCNPNISVAFTFMPHIQRAYQVPESRVDTADLQGRDSLTGALTFLIIASLATAFPPASQRRRSQPFRLSIVFLPSFLLSHHIL
jgi:hypothetical protein